jgi:hypothetical protein
VLSLGLCLNGDIPCIATILERCLKVESSLTNYGGTAQVHTLDHFLADKLESLRLSSQSDMASLAHRQGGKVVVNCPTSRVDMPRRMRQAFVLPMASGDVNRRMLVVERPGDLLWGLVPRASLTMTLSASARGGAPVTR